MSDDEQQNQYINAMLQTVCVLVGAGLVLLILFEVFGG